MMVDEGEAEEEELMVVFLQTKEASRAQRSITSSRIFPLTGLIPEGFDRLPKTPFQKIN
jgi:hypothetical protein